MMLYQYKETCELILDYPKIGGDNIKDFLWPLGILYMKTLVYTAEG